MEKFDNIMVDLETLDTRSTSVILSIGAVEFGPSGLGTRFYQPVDIDTCFLHGLTASASTLRWWMDQSPAAQAAVFVDNAPALYAVLQDFIDAFDWSGKKLWANGADFDLPILGHALIATGLTEPWAYYNSRCYRTLKNAVPKAVFKALAVEPTVAHNALEDAVAQALTATAILDYQEKCYGAFATQQASYTKQA